MRLRPKFLLISFTAVIIAAAGMLSLLREIDRSRSAGVDLRLDGGEAIVVEIDGGGSRGISPHDRILLIDGRPVLELDNASRALARRPGPRHLVVVRNGAPQSVDFWPPPIRPDWKFLFLAAVGAATLGISLEAIRRSPHERGVIPFAWAALTISAVLLVSPVRYDTTGRIIFALEEIARAFFPALLVHFAIQAPSGRKRISGAALLYIPAAVTLLAEADLYVFAGRHLPIAPASAVTLFDRVFFSNMTAATLAAVALWTLRLRTSSGEEKRRLEWLIGGIAGGILPVAVLSAFPRLFGADWSFVRLLSLPALILVPLGIAAALVKFRLQEVDRVAARAAGAAVTLLAALLVFGTVNLFLERLLPALSEPPRHLASFTAGFGMTMLLAPTRRRISDWILMIQHRAGETERLALVDFARELAIHDNPAQLGEALLVRIERAIPLERINLYFADESGQFRRVRPDSFLPPVLPVGGAIHILDQTQYRHPVSFPMVSRGRIVGLLVASGADGLPPDSADQVLLEALASSAAVALDNARLYLDLAREHDRVRQLAEFNERVLESSGSAIAVVDGTGRILASNSRLALWLGLERSDLPGRILEELFAPAASAESGGGEVAVSWIPPRQERARSIEIRREPLRGVPGATVVVASDVTEADSLRRELAARERLAAVGLVAASVAHEVNTPLAGISSYAQMLLQETSPNDPHHGVLEKIERQTFRASRLVRDVLDMARGGPIEHRLIDLRDVASAALLAAEAALQGANVHVETAFPENPVLLAGDAVRLERAAINVLQNAKDAAPGGCVRIAVGGDADGVWLTIADDGRGMSPEERQRAFEPLYSTKGRAGTGLGLALAAEVVRAHGGKLTLDAAPVRGTVVTLRLPRGSDIPCAA